MFALQKTALFIPLLHRWRQPTPAERACSSPDAGEKGKGKYAVLPSDQRCRPAGFGFCQAETRSSGSWRVGLIVLGKAKRIGLVAMNAHVPKAGGSRPVSETIFDEKTSEISFQAWQPDRQCRYIHQSWQSRARQRPLASKGVFDFRQRNPAAEPDENIDIPYLASVHMIFVLPYLSVQITPQFKHIFYNVYIYHFLETAQTDFIETFESETQALARQCFHFQNGLNQSFMPTQQRPHRVLTESSADQFYLIRQLTFQKLVLESQFLLLVISFGLHGRLFHCIGIAW
ncbi:Hypothetical_protein [Hexamita inflata]|uniref:Hypothetical_protein n=1 Tax=Hexamita inflata TaxID=28002 RepID=A0AA86UJD5_9EUKA|nr:Hypothetical protein HINF_LOCUS45659 [Hexamita inflata]